MQRIQSILQSGEPYIRQIVAMPHAPVRSLVIEGGTREHRTFMSFVTALLFSCTASNGPCYQCDACKTITPYSTIPKEYATLEKKHKQEHGIYIILGDIIYLNGIDGIYTKQITMLKKQLCDAPRFNKHIVIIDNCHAIHSIKEIANALLKVIEEASSCIFVITAPERNSLIQTILSRSFVISLPFTTSQSLSLENVWIDALISFLQHGSGWFSKSYGKEECLHEDVSMLLLACSSALCECLAQNPQSQLAHLLMKAPSLSQCISIVKEAEDALQNNVSSLLVADTLALKLYTLLHS